MLEKKKSRVEETAVTQELVATDDDRSPASSPPTPFPDEEIVETSTGRVRRIAIIVLIVSSNMVQMISNMIGLGAGLEISSLLGKPVGPGNANWAAASYPLTQGTFVLMSGRLGTVYGHRNILIVGATWLVIWSLVNGFCRGYVSFNIVRALSGIGGGLIMPNAVALISTTIPPGKMRNITLGFFGASAPIGGYLGAVWSGIMIEYATWKWIFFGIAIIGACVFGALAVLLPTDHPIDKGGKVDWIGATLGISGLILFSIAWNQASSSGWEGLEIGLIVASIPILAAFAIWEHRYASEPVMPLGIWKMPCFTAVMIINLFTFMANGIFLWYMVAWLQLLREESVLDFAVQWTPFAIVAVLGTFGAGWLIPRLAAQWILAIGVSAILAANVLLATMPVQQTYWAQVFPSTICMGLSPDFVYVAAQIIMSNNVSRRQQGVAASLLSTLNLYGTTLGLGFGGTVDMQVKKHHDNNDVLGYRAALAFGAALACAALVVDFLFIRVDKDKREGWTDPEDIQAALENKTWGATPPQETFAV